MKLHTVDSLFHGVHLYESKHLDGDIIDDHHHAIHQILYALEGEGSITLDGRQYEFKQDTAALIVPHSNHSVFSESKLTLLVLAFEDTAIDSFARSGLLHTSFPTSAFLQLSPFAAADLRQLLRKMLFEQTHPDALGRWAQQIYILEILLVLARTSQSATITDSNSLRAERIRSYIDTHFFAPLTAGDIAARLGMGARHVNNIFKEHYRITPIQYLTEVRIGLAKKLLAETDKDIASVCFEVGYETLPTFYRAFKNIVKMSPNMFRQQSKG
ncbi:AraC family transcriptional regulator [Paenibacillus xerothermodurans]|uniref:AraC family transcriptional regulator n=1 Tax=Paenibacillus xerothermodurans TaxID=1977292 RepID=A0A2W1NFK9_PAEXE|nr:AraC family transcriptional regulator [Paenibacillus xerothermodurans]PZE22774.1 AraC family transcriptional regulator [Paenibacillus xerothermodurans]